MVLLPRRWHILLTDKWLNNFQLKMMKLVPVAQNCEFVKVGFRHLIIASRESSDGSRGSAWRCSVLNRTLRGIFRGS